MKFPNICSTILLCTAIVCICVPSLFAADPTISNIKVEVLKHDDETESQYVKITYTAKDFAAKGSIVKFLADCKGLGNNNFSERPIAAELSGDIGLVTGDGQKTIIWEDEKTLIRLGKQEKFSCNVVLSIEGSEASISEVSLNVMKFQDATWHYFNPSLLRMKIEKMTWVNPEFSCSPLGDNWHGGNTIPFGAIFYKVSDVTQFPAYKGRNPSDKFKGVCDKEGCSSFLAIQDYGKPTQVIWANFTKRFVKTVDVNGTNITQDFEFQFRYVEKTVDGSKSLVVVNAGKQGQQIFSELQRGETMHLNLETATIGEARSSDFTIEVPRREWKHFYNGRHIFTVKVANKKAKFIGSDIFPNAISLELANDFNEVRIGEALKFKNLASFVIDTTPGSSKIVFTGNLVMNDVDLGLISLVASNITLTESLEFSSNPLVLGVAAGTYYLGGIAPIIERLRMEGDPESPTDMLIDLRLILQTFSDGCDILFHPSDNTGGIVFKDFKISPSGWELPTGLQVNNVGIANSKDWCIKNMLCEYNTSEKKFTFDILFKTKLFSDAGGGFTYIDRKPEQFKVLFKLDANNKYGIPVPMPNPPPFHYLVWKGFEFEMSNWQTGPKTIRGTAFLANRNDWTEALVFSDLKAVLPNAAADWQIFDADMSLKGNEFGEFEAEGKLRIFGKIDVWAAQLRGTFAVAINPELCYFGLNNIGADIAQFGGDKFFCSGTLSGSLNVLPKFIVSGLVRGDIYIPDLFKNHPVFQLVNAKLGLPYRVSAAQLMIRNTQVSFDMDLGWLGVWGAWINLSKSPITETSEFIGFQEGTVQDLGGIAFHGKGNAVQANDTTYVSFTINKPTNYAYAQIKSADQPYTFLIAPSKQQYTKTSADSTVIFSPAASASDVGLWVLKNPEQGEWKLGVVGKKTGDSVRIWSIVKPRPEFSYSVKQNARTITCTWDKTSAPASSIIDFYIDTDDKNNDGYRIGTIDEKTGTFSYTLSDSLRECGYYIYAVRWDNDRATNFIYSPTYLPNPKQALVAPTNAVGFYTNQNVVNLSWNKSLDPNAHLYLIRVRDESGKDSLYATVHADFNAVQLYVENPETKTFFIQTIGENNTTGCWAKFASLVLDVEDELTHLATNTMMDIIPTPSNARATLVFRNTVAEKVEIIVYDLMGKERLHFDAGYQEAGTQQIQLQLSNLETGAYIVRLVTGKEQYHKLMSVVR